MIGFGVTQVDRISDASDANCSSKTERQVGEVEPEMKRTGKLVTRKSAPTMSPPVLPPVSLFWQYQEQAVIAAKLVSTIARNLGRSPLVVMLEVYTLGDVQCGSLDVST